MRRRHLLPPHILFSRILASRKVVGGQKKGKGGKMKIKQGPKLRDLRMLMKVQIVPYDFDHYGLNKIKFSQS